MYGKVKSGKEILDDFFSNLNSISNIDDNIANKIVELYNKNKLTQKNISNFLSKMREEEVSGKNKKSTN